MRYPHWTVECGFRWGLGQSIPHLGYDRIRPTQHVSGCESEQPDIGQQQPILAPVVFNEAGAMRLAVVFNPEPVFPVVEIWAAKKGTSFVPDGHLHIGTRQPIQHERHS